MINKYNQTFRMKNYSKIIKRLIIINVIMFVLANIFTSTSLVSGGDGTSFIKIFGLHPNLLDALIRPWSFISFQFLHLDFFHILFNMLYLWWFGKILQEGYGGQSVLASYILGGLVGGALVIFSFTFLLPVEMGAVSIGASAGVMAIMVASGVIFPNRYINLFLIGPIKLKWIVLSLFILSSIIAFHSNIGGKIGHIGGAIFGFIYATQLKKGKNIAKWFDNLMIFLANKLNVKTSGTVNKGNIKTFRSSMDRRPKSVKKDIEKAIMNKEAAKREVEQMLDKINKSGYKNMSDSEKKRLEKLSKYY